MRGLAQLVDRTGRRRMPWRPWEGLTTAVACGSSDPSPTRSAKIAACAARSSTRPTHMGDFVQEEFLPPFAHAAARISSSGIRTAGFELDICTAGRIGSFWQFYATSSRNVIAHLTRPLHGPVFITRTGRAIGAPQGGCARYGVSAHQDAPKPA
ncbi:hypothetical protein SVIO_052650 [Streptomyces violaceusniger]|uniref:Uncharacterized protein n=1 Tax=Streptomyces violaceusniger TaxID=68280 RepID=A0A4D4L0P2_STRVO|nr:hypothetical protein SVIO_052650 [Streptomyces violaceusniger]